MAQHEFPFRRAEGLLFRVYALFGLKRKFRRFGRGAFVSPYANIYGAEFMSLGDHAIISRNSRVMALAEYAGERFQPSIVIGEGTYVGQNCVISAAGTITIGRDVTFGDNVYLGCAQHGHDVDGTSVLRQPLIIGDIDIGDRAWLGYGVFITARGRLTIGENAIVSANSVVTKDVPAFTIVAGAPAEPIKRYDHDARAWVRISDAHAADAAGRCG